MIRFTNTTAFHLQVTTAILQIDERFEFCLDVRKIPGIDVLIAIPKSRQIKAGFKFPDCSPLFEAPRERHCEEARVELLREICRHGMHPSFWELTRQ